ncbi:head GIN domain-containing protein [Pedobacter sp. Hv1]|uniref:head GIN domain-containing protein n=1 Tax=Pedobacter sp. Hv1 TaxID=1740090 RepID=UPI000A47B00E|nr:head GIN domain-containing protein [Pedobacter sp. Hv1]
MRINQTIKASIFSLFIIGLSITNVNAQNSKNVGVKNFNSIAVRSGIDLYLTQGTSETLTIKGDADLIKDVIVEQNGADVTIRYKEGVNWGRLFKNQSIKVYVNYKNLKGLTASGGSDVYTENTLKTDLLNVRASGGSDVKLTLACKDLNLEISGGSDANLSGSGENMTLTASGGSDVDAYGYTVNYAKVNVSGGSDANIFVNKGLEAGASGGSDVSYKGNASLKKTTSSKSGDIRRVN